MFGWTCQDDDDGGGGEKLLLVMLFGASKCCFLGGYVELVLLLDCMNDYRYQLYFYESSIEWFIFTSIK